jgi:tetratricopeptide (TPR) repeat protein
VKMRALAWAATLVLGWTVPAVQALPNEILIAQISAQNYFELSEARFKRKDYPGAVEGAAKAISLKPDYAEAYFLRGTARTLLQDYQGAIEDCTEAIRLNPDYANAYVNRGKARFNRKDYQGALEDGTKAISIKPDYAEAYFLRGATHDSLRDYRGAESDWQKAADLFLKNEDIKGYQKAIDKQKSVRQAIPPQPNKPSATRPAQSPSKAADPQSLEKSITIPDTTSSPPPRLELGPRIAQAAYQPAGRVFFPGDLLEVTLQGDPGSQAYFKIDGFTAEVKMLETTPGNYTGQVRIGEQLDVPQGFIQIVLEKNGARSYGRIQGPITIVNKRVP